MKRIIKWVIFNGLLAGAVYFGIIEQIAGVERIAYFLAWVAFVLCWFQTTKSAHAIMRKTGRAVPVWVDVPFDIMITLAFIWKGAWVTGSFYLLHLMIQQGCWMEALKGPEKDNED